MNFNRSSICHEKSPGKQCVFRDSHAEVTGGRTRHEAMSLTIQELSARSACTILGLWVQGETPLTVSLMIYSQERFFYDLLQARSREKGKVTYLLLSFLGSFRLKCSAPQGLIMEHSSLI